MPLTPHLALLRPWVTSYLFPTVVFFQHFSPRPIPLIVGEHGLLQPLLAFQRQCFLLFLPGGSRAPHFGLVLRPGRIALAFQSGQPTRFQHLRRQYTPSSEPSHDAGFDCPMLVPEALFLAKVDALGDKAVAFVRQLTIGATVLPHIRDEGMIVGVQAAGIKAAAQQRMHVFDERRPVERSGGGSTPSEARSKQSHLEMTA